MSIKFCVNGFPYEVNLVDYPPDVTLNTFLREHLHLTATKYMCLEGGCGACICVIERKNPADNRSRTRAANSCLTLLNTCAGVEITTCEGLGNARDGYHPIQKRLAKMNGSQCGYCSPGFVMNMYGLLKAENDQVTMSEIENAFGGNICRCTGYRPILDAMKSFAVDSNVAVPADCCDIEDTFELLCLRTGQCDASVCRKSTTNGHKPMIAYENGSQWFYPLTMLELFDALQQVGDEEYMLVAGNTAHGVYRRPYDLKHFIYVNYIPELQRRSIGADGLILGANVTLTDAMKMFLVAAQTPGYEYCQQLWEHFDKIANVPVRNNGTLAGNISIKKSHREFPSDVFITLETLNVEVIVQRTGTEEHHMALLDYLNDDTPKLVLKAFKLSPYAKNMHIFKSYKILARAQNAPAYVNAGFLLKVDPKTHVVRFARICFGGIRPDFVHATSVETLLVGKNLYDTTTVSGVFQELEQTLLPEDKLPKTSPEYRMKLACGLFYKFLLESAPADAVKPINKSGGPLLSRPLSSGSQIFKPNAKVFPVTQPVTKLEGLIQCTGEAKYMNDMWTTSNAVYCAFVTATKVGATIEHIDASVALRIRGVVSFFSAKDIPGTNSFNLFNFAEPPLQEEIFCTGSVKYYDQPLGVIVAHTHDIAVHASECVRVTYVNYNGLQCSTNMANILESKQTDRIIEITKSPAMEPEMSDKTANELTADLRDRGILELGLQYHFTMEPQTTIAVPYEERLRVYSSTQFMDMTQTVIAQMLQLKLNSVQLEVRRIGGAYGAKVSRGNPIACAASLVAYKLNRPARFVQTIESMMTTLGKRWACRSDYEFLVSPNGLIKSAKNIFYEDAGCSLNENVVGFITTPSLKNVYNLNDANFRVNGNAVLTDAASNTLCRAPGTLEAISMTENMIEHIAFTCNLDPADVRLVNLRRDNQMGQLLPRFLQTTEYRSRRSEIDDFNRQNRWRKRGIGLSLMEFPLDTVISLGFSATVAIYHSDGSVVISHGGIEMGQGINTKVAQVAAFILKVPLEFVKIESSDTVNGANSIPTANSMSSEMVCLAVHKACSTLNARLAAVRSSLPKNATWPEIVQTAWNQGVNMIASDAYKLGDISKYTILGLSLTELEVDILTGNHILKRVDILEDAGQSLNPLIDVGQVEGAFTMGLGYFLTERLVYDRQSGQLLTNRTWNYYPPGTKDIPVDFRIELLQNSSNPMSFMGSKSASEAAVCLSISSIFALQHALQSARQDAGLPRKWIRLGAPTTPEQVLLSAGFHIDEFIL